MSLVIVVGLPGSGKTEHCKQYAEDGHVVFDDYLRTFWNGDLIKTLREGKKVCINDPRLCDFRVFDRHLKVFLNLNIEGFSIENIKVVLFKNEPVKCLNNAQRRGTQTGLQRGIENDIMTMSRLYDLEKYKSVGVECEDIDCFS